MHGSLRDVGSALWKRGRNDVITEFVIFIICWIICHYHDNSLSHMSGMFLWWCRGNCGRTRSRLQRMTESVWWFYCCKHWFFGGRRSCTLTGFHGMSSILGEVCQLHSTISCRHPVCKNWHHKHLHWLVQLIGSPTSLHGGACIHHCVTP